MENNNSSGLVIIEPHKKVSREVKIKDFPRIKNEYFPLRMLMEQMQNTKFFKNVYAIAHPQVTKKDPLRFFVINSSDNQLKSKLEELRIDDLIINPVIINHVKHASEKEEGCLSYPGYPSANVERWQKIEVKFQTIDFEGEKLIDHKLGLSGKLAEIFQHEIDHFNAKYVWTGKI